jgi:hypothetical protein
MPHIYTFDSFPSNALGFEWIFTEKMPGTSYIDMLGDIAIPAVLYKASPKFVVDIDELRLKGLGGAGIEALLLPGPRNDGGESREECARVAGRWRN